LPVSLVALNTYLQQAQEDKTLQAAKVESKTQANDVAKKRKSASEVSRGVDKLKKARTTGMSKLSTFFTKNVAQSKLSESSS